ncbi:unnamed protein product [Rhodiola kirilowii]
MKIFSWNCRGLGRPRTVRTLVDAIRTYRPQIVCLLETKKKEAGWDSVKWQLGLRNCFFVASRGKAGGLAVLWSEEVDLCIRSYSDWHVDMEVRDNQWSRITLFYGDPKVSGRKHSWTLLRRLCTMSNLPWMVIGDFNEVVCDDEVKGTRPRQVWQMNNFREALKDCGLSDLGFRGYLFTFSNRREGEHEMRARLDRAVADDHWRNSFPNAMISHCHLLTSDHQMLILDTEGSYFKRRKKPFRFEAMWIDHPDFERVMAECWRSSLDSHQNWQQKLNDCGRALSVWNRSKYGNVQRRIKDLKHKLDEIKCAEGNETKKWEEERISEELDVWLAREEIMWQQRSRVLWLNQGDRNTKFFHARATHRKKKNWIYCLKDEQGVRHTGEKEFLRIAAAYFHKIFSSSSEAGRRDEEDLVELVNPVISEDMNNALLGDISEEEIRKSIFAQGPLKAPGLDGFPGIFYQKYWNQIKHHVIRYVRRFWEEGSLDEGINKTLIILIPKKEDTDRMEDWRPISLCSVAIKIITKILASRLQPILKQVISVYQSAFIKDRIISDNFIVAHEISHFLRCCKEDKKFYASIKVDMSKAYDRVEWCFLEKVMRRMGFADLWVDRVMRCVRSVSYVVKVNDQLTEEFKPARGLRQGDPLSPYLFLLCTEVLNAKLLSSLNKGEISGVRIGKLAPVITHLFFADDSMFFIRASTSEVLNFKRILMRYEEVSGQRVNFEKSEISFSRNTPADVRAEITEILRVRQVPFHSKYLGLPLVMGQKKSEMFRCITEKIWRRISDWKCKFLSAAGREVLIKAVLQALPIYTMSVYKLPEKCIQEVTKLILRFWWNKKDNERGVSWIRKEVLQKSKLEGGLGFRDLKCFNEAFLMKICWRIAKYPHLLMSRLLLSRYCPEGNLFSVRLGSRPSHVWRGVMKVIDVFKEATWWDSYRGTIRWKHSSNGLFSVKSAYDLIKKVQCSREKDIGEQSDSSGLSKFWKRVWACKVPNKIKIFCWRMYYNSLPDARNLWRRGINLDCHCKICGADMESVIHVTKDCWWARELMGRMGVSLPDFDGQFIDPADWIWACAGLLNTEDLRSFLVSLWLCWKNRGRVWHDQESWGIDRAVIIGKNMLRLLDSCRWPDPREGVDYPVSRLGPGAGVLMVYVDRSWDVESKKAGLGVVVVGQEGSINCVLAQWTADCGCASEVEGMALLRGFELARRLNIKEACFKIDSLDVFKAISVDSGTGEWCDAWLEAGVDFLRSNAGWSVSLVGRDGNVLADRVAAKARIEEWSWSSLDAIPRCVAVGS